MKSLYLPYTVEVSTRLFGVPIHDALCKGESFGIPQQVHLMIEEIEKRGLELEGIGRIAGSHERIEKLKEEIDSGFEVAIAFSYQLGKTVNFSQQDVYDICGLLKLYFRELPEPLITPELYEKFIGISKKGCMS